MFVRSPLKAMFHFSHKTGNYKPYAISNRGDKDLQVAIFRKDISGQIDVVNSLFHLFSQVDP